MKRIILLTLLSFIPCTAMEADDLGAVERLATVIYQYQDMVDNQFNSVETRIFAMDELLKLEADDLYRKAIAKVEIKRLDELAVARRLPKRTPHPIDLSRPPKLRRKKRTKKIKPFFWENND